MTDHTKHCFVAMAYGETEADHELLDGWFREVIRPVIAELGYEPQLATSRNAPTPCSRR